MLHEPGSAHDAGEDALCGGVAVAFDDDAIDAAEEGPRVISIIKMLSESHKGRLEGDVLLLRRSFELFKDKHADALSCFKEDIASKAIGDENVYPALKDLACFDI